MKSAFLASIAFCAVLALAGGTARAASPRQFTVAGTNVRLDIDAAAFHTGPDPIVAWAKRSAEIVAGYYGMFPTRDLHIQVVPQAGDGVRSGKTWGHNGGFIRLQVGRDVTDTQLQNDWVLVHEMTHLALPEVGEDHAWLSEGLAVYVEGVARVQAGNRTQPDVWSEEIRSMPRGLPEPGDRGLDHTHTWGRTYWGGAMFCLLADVDIRRRTQNRFGLQDAVRAITRASGGLASEWPIERVLKTGDAAVGTTVLEELYDQMRDAAVTPDLMALWRKLGVEPDGSSVRLSDDAPLAGIRQSIMRAPVSKS
ncbi:MAG: hypothetical protein JWM63_1750 [Gammaproteobacteria bacterium]|jgi:hypothetical protein|nr:hypothetical protein [Gammaproteobacteria bacterium]